MTPVHPIAIALLPEITNIQFTAHVLIAPHVSDKRLHSAVQLLTAIHLLSDVKKLVQIPQQQLLVIALALAQPALYFGLGPEVWD